MDGGLKDELLYSTLADGPLTMVYYTFQYIRVLVFRVGYEVILK